MRTISSNLFLYVKKANTLVCERTELAAAIKEVNYRVPDWFSIRSEKSGMVITFVLIRTEWNRDDIAGFRYRVDANDPNFDKAKGVEVLIIND